MPDDRRSFVRRYPALGFLVAAGALAILLPSGLTIPSSQPGSLAEFAPEPGEGTGEGDLSEIGGTSSSRGLGSGGSGPGGPGGAEVVGDPGQRPASLKRCVGRPPRQTEDPLSPPCVPFFRGSNGGTTYRGVSADEVRVVVYIDIADQCGTSRGCERSPPAGTIVDLRDPPTDDSYIWLRQLWAYQRYFNDRFQTYGRFVHLYAQIRSGDTPERRAADARAAIDEVDPFASVSFAARRADVYALAMAEAGVVSFPGSDAFNAAGQPEAFYRRYPALLWSYLGSLERRAAIFTSYVCDKVLPYPVSFSGNAPMNGRPRRLGLLRNDLADRPDLIHFADVIKRGVEDCGGRFEEEGPVRHGQPDERAAATMARFDQSEVTTIIWAGGQSAGDHTRAAGGLDYEPEIVLAGDNLVDGTSSGQLQDQDVWEHARVVSSYTLHPPATERICVQALVEARPSESISDADRFGCRWYPDVRQLFIGIQVAGPRLAPGSMDLGFHAIPDGPSSDPTVPACFYEPGDYTCVKDAAAEWWDPSGTNTNRTTGCWRMMEGGERYLARRWPSGDVERQRSGRDPCNLQNVHPVA